MVEAVGDCVGGFFAEAKRTITPTELAVGAVALALFSTFFALATTGKVPAKVGYPLAALSLVPVPLCIAAQRGNRKERVEEKRNALLLGMNDQDKGYYENFHAFLDSLKPEYAEEFKKRKEEWSLQGHAFCRENEYGPIYPDITYGCVRLTGVNRMPHQFSLHISYAYEYQLRYDPFIVTQASNPAFLYFNGVVTEEERAAYQGEVMHIDQYPKEPLLLKRTGDGDWKFYIKQGRREPYKLLEINEIESHLGDSGRAIFKPSVWGS